MNALEENSRLPVITAPANAAQVQGSTSEVSRAAARSSEARPISRRSTIAMEPMTIVMAST